MPRTECIFLTSKKEEICKKQDLSRAGAKEIKSHRGWSKARIMIYMVKKEKVFGRAKSRRGLDREKVMQGRQREPPGSVMLAVSKRFILPDLRQDCKEHLNIGNVGHS